MVYDGSGVCGGAIMWRNMKQGCTTDFTMEAQYVTVAEVSKEAV